MKKILFFTGAGISAESGIPTFSEQDDIRDKLTRSFALTHKEEYRKTIEQMCDFANKAKPNIAHKAIAKYDYPVITMNIDGLHQKAGSTKVLAIHGKLPEPHELYADNFNELKGMPVLYGDEAPEYSKAIDKVNELSEGDKFIIVGVSFYTAISEQLKYIASCRGADVVILNECATIEVPEICKRLYEDNYVGL